MVYTTTNQSSDRRRGSGGGNDAAYPAVALPTLGGPSYAASSPSPYYGVGGGGNPSGGPASAANGRLPSPSANLGLRKRDAVAILACLFLLRLAFAPSETAGGGGGLVHRSDSSISASMELAFYSPFQSLPPRSGKNANERTARPVPLDVDGDGVVEAMVVPVFVKRQDVKDEKKVELLLEAEKNKRPFAKKKSEDIVVDDVALEGWDEEGTWGLRVLNLKPLRANADNEKQEGGLANAGPFAPRSLFLSPLLPYAPLKQQQSGDHTTTTAEHQRKRVSPDTYPVKLLSVQIPVQRTRLGEEERSRRRHKASGGTGSYGKNSEIPPKDDPKFVDYDRKRHYFCGKDWHHAAQSCHKHCPGGMSSECGDGETCYADTPCDAHIEFDSTSSSRDDANNNKESTTKMALTKSGVLPGVATVWSDGSVSLHVITADIPPSTTGDGQQHRPKRARQKSLKPELELRQLWRVYPLEKEGDGAVSAVEFDELGITFESGAIYGGVSASDDDKETKRFGDNGAILLGGRYTVLSDDDDFHPLKVSFHALDAMTGTSLWELKGNRRSDDNGPAETLNDNNKNNDKPSIPIVHTTSSARRRSHLPTLDVLDPDLDNENAFLEGDDVATSEECMAHFRASVLDPEGGALPHEFWDDGEFGSIGVGRFDRGKKIGGRRWKALGKKGRSYLLNKNKGGGRGDRGGGGSAAAAGLGSIGQGRARATGSGGGKRGAPGSGGGGPSNSWQSDILRRAVPRRLIRQQRYNAQHPRMGRPNVVLFHGREGLSVLSLKNGRPVCHVSLVDRSLYADMDGDGVVDVIQVVTSPAGFEKSSGVQSLIHRLAKEASVYRTQPNALAICHALVTSGLPPREEVFTAPLCLGGPVDPRRPQNASAAPPLLLEGSMGYGNDVVFAMNNGVVVRYDFNGREMWRKRGGLKDGTPSWDLSGNRRHSSAAFLGRIQFGSVRESHSSVSASSHRKDQHRPGSPARPILLSGEDGAVLLSPTSGRVLSSVVYPQRVASQPLLADLDGDGTDDMLVASDDALWGYRVVVETGRSGMFTIVVVTLLIGVALAVLVHRTSHRPGQTPKRSTDA
mmetsp:Transcript_54453/g.115654  ORF Transcript_54453/g.115654 Transcript_54453/m.115654 type:complete len:1080 (+) Transcript_54453:35-3274(+)